MTEDAKYKWIEYHKWHFTANWFKTIIGDLVLNTRVKYGFLGSYNSTLGITPLKDFSLAVRVCRVQQIWMVGKSLASVDIATNR